MCYRDAEYYEALTIASFEPKKFRTVENDGETTVSERTFSGRMTDGRRKALAAYCTKYSGRTYCGCEWDCCGCLSSQRLNWSYSYGQVKVIMKRTYNY